MLFRMDLGVVALIGIVLLIGIVKKNAMTMAALLGAMPLVLSNGVGSEPRRPLGITIIGGLLLSQLLTLYTTPVIHLAFDRLAARTRGGRPAEAGSNRPPEDRL